MIRKVQYWQNYGQLAPVFCPLLPVLGTNDVRFLRRSMFGRSLAAVPNERSKGKQDGSCTQQHDRQGFARRGAFSQTGARL